MQPSDYSPGDRLLHYLALGSIYVGRAAFEFDGIAVRGGPALVDERHVFISGLARAGTTVLMRAFYATGAFRSLTYRDMPFVLMPRIWNATAMPFRRTERAKPRAHGDGILVDFDSPEAFEEVFWRVFSGRQYILDDCLRPYVVGDAVVSLFREYVRRVVQSAQGGDGKRYLSKNNNNILRLPAIRKAFPRAIIIVPFRDPLQQAMSLLNQHMKFTERHARDRFARDYMRWLGHHEFGATHKVFRFWPDVDAAEYSSDDVNYWLRVWTNAYRYLLTHAPRDCRFVSYERLCASPASTLSGIYEDAGLRLDGTQLRAALGAPEAKVAPPVAGDMRSMASQVLEELHARADSLPR